MVGDLGHPAAQARNVKDAQALELPRSLAVNLSTKNSSKNKDGAPGWQPSNAESPVELRSILSESGSFESAAASHAARRRRVLAACMVAW